MSRPPPHPLGRESPPLSFCFALHGHVKESDGGTDGQVALLGGWTGSNALENLNENSLFYGYEWTFSLCISGQQASHVQL